MRSKGSNQVSKASKYLNQQTNVDELIHPCLMIYRLLLWRQLLSASSHEAGSPHLSATIPQVLARIISSTVRWFRTRLANDSVLASRGKKRAEYGSSRSLTTRSRSLANSVSRKMRSGSSGSGLVATPAQYVKTSERVCHDGNKTLSLKPWQVVGSIDFLVLESVWRTAVEDGSKPWRAGVISALRFWAIESSIVDRERRRKSR